MVELPAEGIEEVVPGSVIRDRFRFLGVLRLFRTLGIPGFGGNEATELGHVRTTGVVLELRILEEEGVEWTVELGYEGGVEGDAVNRVRVEPREAEEFEVR